MKASLGLDRPVRSFVALPCPAGLRGALSAAGSAWRRLDADIGWTDPATAHLTLRFLGEADPARLDALHARLPDVAGSVAGFRARGGATGAFPGWSRPRVLWLGIESGGAIERLAAGVEGAAREAGFAPEPRAFTPHLTLGRVRGAHGARRAAAAVRHWSPGVEPEPVTEVVLYRSELGPGRARHVALARYALG